MAVNKVVYNGTALVDLTGDTVTADVLQSGYTAHQADGEQIMGSAVPASNPNLLDNWYFIDPINQRKGLLVVPGQNYYNTTSTANSLGQLDKYYKVDTVSGDWVIFSMNGTQYYARKQFCVSGYTSGYTIDRWIVRFGLLTLNSSGAIEKIQNTDNSNDRNCVLQIIENPEKYVGKKLTFSILYKNLNGSISLVIFSDNSTINFVSEPSILSAGILSFTFTIPENITISGFKMNVMLSPEGSFTPIAAKLELGSQQTLAHKEGDTWVLNDPPPNKATELAKCQRYQIYGEIRALPMFVAYNDCYCFCPTPVSMRGKPAVIGTPNVKDTSNNTINCTVDVSAFHQNGVSLIARQTGKQVYVYGTFGLDANL